MDDLDAHIEAIARFFWGDATRETSEEARFGSRFSKSLDKKNKRWFDHETGKGGNVINLIQEYRGDQPGAVSEFVAEFFGEDATYTPQHADVSDLRVPDAPQKIVATYEYESAEGACAYRVHRMGPRKTFWQQLPDGRKPKDDPNFTPLPFRLPRILANPDAAVWIVEGEKDVLLLESHGLVATCNHGGAGAWDDRHAQWLIKRNVVILPDNDAAGRDHAQKVAASLYGKAAAIKLVELAGLDEKGDVSDWLESNSIDALKSIVRASVPLQRVQTPLPVMSMQEVVEMPPVEWLIEDWISEESLNMIYGASGSGKTFLALSMLCAIAHGRRWYEQGAKRGCCVLVAGEGVGGLRKRLIAYHQEHNLPFDAPLIVIPQAVNLMQAEDIDALIETIEIMRGDLPVKMICIDTLARSMSGAEEDKSKEMGVAIQHMDRLRTHFKAAVVPVHHTGKDNDPSRFGRGSSALIGALDAAIFVAKHDEGMVEVSVRKQKDGEEKPPLWFKARQVAFQRAWHEDPETSLVLDLLEEKPQAAKSRSLSPAQARVMEALREALIKHGRTPHRDGISWVCCTEEQWRDTAMQMTVSESGPDADRKAFARAAKSLISKRLVEKREGLVWKVEMAQNVENAEI